MARHPKRGFRGRSACTPTSGSQPPFFSALLLCAVSVTILGCQQGRTLPATPNLYADRDESPFDAVAPEYQTGPVELFYVTDRSPSARDGSNLSYGSKRSTSVAIGRCIVDIGDGMSWDELVRSSLDPRESVKVPLAISYTEELVRFPSSSAALRVVDGVPVEDPELVAEREHATESALALLSERLAKTQRKEAYVFIHGINNSFEDPMYRMAQLWHMMGRTGVPIVYTWPANPDLGPLRGYTHDRESGEFTVYHLRKFLQRLASCPDLERVHILAHSRGTDIATTALREIHLQAQARGVPTAEELKLGNLILAAPDLDLQVAVQRLRPDLVHLAPSRFTIYVSDGDKAIGIAEWLFSSIERLGRLRSTGLSNEQQTNLSLGVLDLIDAKVSDLGPNGHSYFIDNPAVLSDLILLLRDDRSAGPEHGRPLIRDESGFWNLYDGYPYEGLHARRADIEAEVEP